MVNVIFLLSWLLFFLFCSKSTVVIFQKKNNCHCLSTYGPNGPIHTCKISRSSDLKKQKPKKTLERSKVEVPVDYITWEFHYINHSNFNNNNIWIKFWANLHTFALLWVSQYKYCIRNLASNKTNYPPTFQCHKTLDLERVKVTA